MVSAGETSWCTSKCGGGWWTAIDSAPPRTSPSGSGLGVGGSGVGVAVAGTAVAVAVGTAVRAGNGVAVAGTAVAVAVGTGVAVGAGAVRHATAAPTHIAARPTATCALLKRRDDRRRGRQNKLPGPATG